MTNAARSYWDNVGGEALEASLDNCVQGAHFIVRRPPSPCLLTLYSRSRPQICGMISTYNTKEPYNVKNLQLLIWREIHLYGFLAFSLMPKYREEFFRTMPARVASGEIKYKEHPVRGLENAGKALLNVLQGDNFGTSYVVIADD